MLTVLHFLRIIRCSMADLFFPSAFVLMRFPQMFLIIHNVRIVFTDLLFVVFFPGLFWVVSLKSAFSI